MTSNNLATHEQSRREKARAIEMLQAGIDREVITAELGRSKSWLRHVVSWARAKGVVVPECKMGRRPLGYDAFATLDATPGCLRCGLRGAHECLPQRAEAYLGRREESSGVRYTEFRRASGE